MNRQIGYIINAFLIVFLIFLGSLLIRKIGSVKSANDNLTVEIDNNKTEISPALSKSAANGKLLFLSKCASCHVLFKDMTGPGLIGFEDRGPWSNRKNLYEWIRNPSEFMKKDLFTQELKKQYGSMMIGFSDLSNEQIDAICDYINQSENIRYLPIAER